MHYSKHVCNLNWVNAYVAAGSGVTDALGMGVVISGLIVGSAENDGCTVTVTVAVAVGLAEGVGDGVFLQAVTPNTKHRTTTRKTTAFFTKSFASFWESLAFCAFCGNSKSKRSVLFSTG